MTLPAFADAAPLLLTAERQRLLHGAPAAIDRYLLLLGCSAANPPHATAAVGRWDSQTHIWQKIYSVTKLSH